MIEVEVGGTIIEFPDDTPYETIKSVSRRAAGGFQPSPLPDLPGPDPQRYLPPASGLSGLTVGPRFSTQALPDMGGEMALPPSDSNIGSPMVPGGAASLPFALGRDVPTDAWAGPSFDDATAAPPAETPSWMRALTPVLGGAALINRQVVEPTRSLIPDMPPGLGEMADSFRQSLPSVEDVARSPAMAPVLGAGIAGAQRMRDEVDDSQFAKGVIAGLVGTNVTTGGAALEGLGHILGNEGMVETGRRIAGSGEEGAKAWQPRVRSYRDVGGLGDALAYLGYSAGQGSASMAPGMAVGVGVGALTANPIAGFVAGAAGPSFVQNYGDIYSGIKSDPVIQQKIAAGELSEREAALYAAAGAIPMAALDTFSLGTQAGAALRAAQGELRTQVIRRVALELVKGSGVEGVTEGLQEVISQATQAFLGDGDWFRRQRIDAVIDNTIGGAATGFVARGAGVAGGAAVAQGPQPSGLSALTVGPQETRVEPPPPQSPFAAPEEVAPVGPEPAPAAPAAPMTPMPSAPVAPEPGVVSRETEQVRPASPVAVDPTAAVSIEALPAEPLSPLAPPPPSQPVAPAPAPAVAPEPATPIPAPPARLGPPDPSGAVPAVPEGAIPADVLFGPVEPQAVPPAPPEAAATQPAPPAAPFAPAPQAVSPVPAPAAQLVPADEASMAGVRVPLPPLGPNVAPPRAAPAQPEPASPVPAAPSADARAGADQARIAPRAPEVAATPAAPAPTVQPQPGPAAIPPAPAVPVGPPLGDVAQAQGDVAQAVPASPMPAEPVAAPQSAVAPPAPIAPAEAPEAAPAPPDGRAQATAAEPVRSISTPQGVAPIVFPDELHAELYDFALRKDRNSDPYRAEAARLFDAFRGWTADDTAAAAPFSRPQHVRSLALDYLAAVREAAGASWGRDAQGRVEAPDVIDTERQADYWRRAAMEARGAPRPAEQAGIPPSAPSAATASAGPTLAAPRGARIIRADTAITPAGTDVPVRYAVVELDSLTPSQTDEGAPNPAFTGAQPRDRTRAASQAQIAEIAARLDPRRLDVNPSTADGAPLVGPDGMVDSGNGRVLALRRAYRQALPASRRYREHLAAQGYPVEGMKSPVLVRINDAPAAERARIADESNARSTLAMSATEQAMADAQKMAPILSYWGGGDVTAASNRAFVRLFAETIPAADRATFIDSHGQLSAPGIRRIQAAMLAAAYGDANLVETLIESADSDIKAIGGALIDAAPAWAQMRAEAEAGTIDPAVGDVTPDLLEAVRLVQRARDEGQHIADFVAQVDMFGGRAITPNAELFLRLFFIDTRFRTPRGRPKMAFALNYYAGEARKTQPGPGLIGGEGKATAAGILEAARKKIDEPKPQQQGDLLQPRRGQPDGQGLPEAGRDAGRRAAVQPRDGEGDRGAVARDDGDAGPGGRALPEEAGRRPVRSGAADGVDPAQLFQAARDDVEPTAQRQVAREVDLDALKAELRRLAPLARVEMIDRLIDPRGRPANAAYLRGVVQVAMTARDPMNALRHEAIHALRDLNLIRPEEWRRLEAKAKSQWLAEHRIAERYPTLTREQQIEEGVAEAFAEHTTTPLPAGFRAIYENIKRFFERLGAWLRGQGFQTVDDVLGRIESGEVGRRVRQEPTLERTEASYGDRGEGRMQAGEPDDAGATRDDTASRHTFQRLTGVEPEPQPSEVSDNAAIQHMVEEIERVVSSDRLGSYGLRVGEGALPTADEILPPSRRWDDGSPTDEVLPGTSVVSIDRRGATAAVQTVAENGYLGDWVALVEGDKVAAGEDPGEALMTGARVVATWPISYRDMQQWRYRAKDEAASPQKFQAARPDEDPAASPTRRSRTVLDAIKDGQPVDRIFRAPWHLLGGVTERGEWKPGQRLVDWGAEVITEKKLDPNGRLAWLNPAIEKVRAGVIDRYGQDAEYTARDRARQREEAATARKGLEIVQKLVHDGMGADEAKVLQAVLTGEQIEPGRWQKIAEPIRAAIDELGAEAMALGLISPESYARNKGTYLHRVYIKHEATPEGGKLGELALNMSRRQRVKMIGSELKGRGIFIEVDAADIHPLLRTAKSMVRVLDDARTDTAGKERNFARAYVDAGKATPDRYAEWTDRGAWEVRSVGGGKVVLWRDYTPAERTSMGEILDSRYTIAKTFYLMAHDLATGRFYQDIATNEAWATKMQPADGTWTNASGTWWETDSAFEWVKVPDTAIPDTGGVKKWGALSGMYVRAEIWRDLNQVATMAQRNFWDAFLTQWKLNKALALDTPIPTPSGWTTMGDIAVGDVVFDERGQVCTVLDAKDVVEGRPCYEVLFSDGARIVCDEDHWWFTTHRNRGGGVRTTKEVRESLTINHRGEAAHSIGLADALDLPAAALLIDPYVLGVWLGDGDACGPRITVGAAETSEMRGLLSAAGTICSPGCVDKRTGASSMTLRLPTDARQNGVKMALAALGILGKKAIPSAYLRASRDQRMALLHGLMDTDGWITAKGTCGFGTSTPALRDGVIELLRSLGFKPTVSTLIPSCDGKPGLRAWRIQFQAYADAPVFRLGKKLARLRTRPERAQRSSCRQIVAINPVPSVPVRCIAVSSPSHLYLAGAAMIPTHNTARNPVTHMNNTLSNVMFMDMNDVRLQDLVAGIRSYMAKDQDFKDAEANGAFGTGFVGAEIKREVLEPILREIEAQATGRTSTGPVTRLLNQWGAVGRLMAGIGKGVKAVDQKMLAAYRAEDDVFRMALYKRRIAMGDSPLSAADAAREVFLDYDIRAPWINTARRTVLPFIAYPYRAIPGVAKALAVHPWKLAKYAAIAQLLNWAAYQLWPGDEDEERRNLRKDQRGYTWLGSPRMLRLWTDSDGANFLDIRRWIPAGDIFDTNQGQSVLPLPGFLQVGGPLATGIELLANRSLFTGQDIINEETDDPIDRAKKLADYAWKSWAPSAFYVPGSWYWSKMADALGGARDRITGAPLDPAKVLASSIGIKIQGQDLNQAKYWRQLEHDRIKRELSFLKNRTIDDHNRGALSDSTYRSTMDDIAKKEARLDEQNADILKDQAFQAWKRQFEAQRRTARGRAKMEDRTQRRDEPGGQDDLNITVTRPGAR